MNDTEGNAQFTTAAQPEPGYDEASFDHGQNSLLVAIDNIYRGAQAIIAEPAISIEAHIPTDREDAHDHCQRLVQKLHRVGCVVGIYAGQVFTIIERRELWKGRAESFVDYLRDDLFNPFGYDTVRRLQRVYTFFCELRSFTPEQLEPVEVKKLDAIVAHERQRRKCGQEPSSTEQLVKLIEEATELTRADFQASLREARGEDALKVGTIEKLLLMYQCLDGQSRMEFKRGMAWIDSGKKRFEKETGWIDTEP